MSIKNKKSGIISSVVVSCLLLAISLFFIINRQNIIDQITVWQYKSTDEINNLVERAGMSDKGKFFFLASQPKLETKENINQICNNIENTTSILGCYSEYRIYISNVADPQLDGIREITAVHETLHAIYYRLSDNEKNKLNKLIETEYKKIKEDKDLKDLMAFYERTEPGQRDNELHSIIGTEVASISPELQAYYNKYFSDRQKAVSLNAKYIGVFKSLKSRADLLYGQYNELNLSISTRLAQYNSDVEEFNRDVATFNQRAENKSFSSQAQIMSEWNALSARSAELNITRTNIENDKKTLDAILNEYNSIASESKKLYDIIDSTLAPATSL